MITRAIRSALVIACVIVAYLATCAAPSLAHLVYIHASKFGSTGTGVGQFDKPVGVAMDEGAEDVYVVDEGNNRVEKFEADGKYLSEFDGSETPAKAFASPTYIAVDNSGGAAKGRVYVVDKSQNTIDAFDSSGKYLFQIESESVQAITTDSSGHLWAWTSQLRFEEFSESGTLIIRQPVDRAAEPGIVIDSDGNVYIVNGSRRIGRYSPPAFPENNESLVEGARTLAINPATNNIFQDTGSSIIEWPPFGEGPGLWERTEETFSGSLTNSEGLAVNGKTGTLYASDATANDIEVFEDVITPDVTTGAASKLTTSSGTIEGTVNPDKTKTHYSFEWGETASYGHSTSVEDAGEGETAIPVSVNLAGLEANTTYHYRLVASNESSTSQGSDETFTTRPVPPVLESEPAASDITRSSVVLHMTINPRHNVTAYHFVYVEQAAYDPAASNPYSAGGVTSPSTAGAGAGGQQVEQLLSGLRPETTYHYMVVAINGAGRVTGTDAMFTTGAPTPPVAVTEASSGIAQNSATIGGFLNTSGLPTTYGFEIGTSTDYGPATGLGSVGAGLSEAGVTLSLSGLQPGTTYHYRLTATNIDGTSYGADQTFTTGVFANTFAAPPAPLPFVEVPAIAIPSEPKTRVVKTKAGKAKGKKAKKRGKEKTKAKGKKAKHRKKK